MSAARQPSRWVLLTLAAGLVALLLIYPPRGGRPLGPAESALFEECPPWDQCGYLPLVEKSDGLPFYGMDVVPVDQLGHMPDLGIEVIGQVFPHDGTPAAWLDQLDQARAHGLKVVAWLWPEGWTWDGARWVIDAQAQSFVRTVADHPATLAVYALHEPYWQGCWGCGYTTAEQQQLYQAIKALADVPVYSAVDSMSFWTAQGPETAFAPGICDYCLTWYYPLTDQGYDRAAFISRLQADLAVARDRAPESKFVWALQAFAQDPPGYRLPTAEEMVDMAKAVYDAGADGALWYVWTFNTLYDDFLSNHPELFPAVREIYEEHVQPRQ